MPSFLQNSPYNIEDSWEVVKGEGQKLKTVAEHRGEILLLHNGFYCSALLYNAPFTSHPSVPTYSIFAVTPKSIVSVRYTTMQDLLLIHPLKKLVNFFP